MTSQSDKQYGGKFTACSHRIEFYFDVPPELVDSDGNLDEVLKDRLDKEAEEKARHDIAEDYVAGELCTIHTVGDKDHELFGWWSFEP